MNLSFAYRGTEFPNQEMIDWFDYSFNQEPRDMDELESDIWYSELKSSFLEEFSNELIDLSYMEMIDVFDKSKIGGRNSLDQL